MPYVVTQFTLIDIEVEVTNDDLVIRPSDKFSYQRTELFIRRGNRAISRSVVLRQ